MSDYDESCLVFAARYAHHRETGAANIVVSSVIANWGKLSDQVRNQLQYEAQSATCNIDDWKRLIDYEN